MQPAQQQPSINTNQKIIILSLRGGQLHLGAQFFTKQTLARLFDLEKFTDEIVLLDPEGEEVEIQDDRFLVSPEHHYTILTESDINSDVDPEFTLDEKGQHIVLVDQLRRQFLRSQWKLKHHWLHHASPEHIAPSFLSKIDQHPSEFSSLLSRGLYLVPELFSKKFINDLLDEYLSLQASGLPLLQPNTMNRYGCVLEDVGLNKVFMSLFHSYFVPFLTRAFPTVDCSKIEKCHSFIVQYTMGTQKDLGFHFDESAITLNLCLGKIFSGGDLYFKGLRDDPTTHEEKVLYSHIEGQCLVHEGQHRHGVLPLTMGERYNLIVWYQISQPK